MRRSRLFSPTAIESSNGSHTLGEQSTHYLRHVLRLKPGAELIIFDGKGGEYSSRLLALGKKQVDIELLDYFPEHRASALSVTVAMATLRGDRMDYALQKCAELGARRIQPLLTQRTEFKSSAASVEKRLKHWRGVLHDVAPAPVE